MRQLWLFNSDENTNGAHPDIFLTLPKTFSSRNLRDPLAHHQLKFLELTSSHGSQLKISSCRPQRRQAGNKEKAIRDEGGGGVHRKRSTSDLCVLTVATAVSGSAEHKSHQGELCDRQGRLSRGERVCLNKIQCPTVFIAS